MAEEVHTIASGLNTPNGVAWKDGALYVAEVVARAALRRHRRAAGRPAEAGGGERRLPGDRHHGWKFIRFGPDGKLYVPRRGAVQHLRADNPTLRHDHAHERRRAAEARDLRARHPQHASASTGTRRTHELWFTDNGRDMLGDDVPPDELNHAPKAGMNFGFPYCHGGAIADPRVRPQARRARSSRRRRRARRRTSPRSACASTPARMFPRALPRPDLHRRARLVEPLDADRLPRRSLVDRRRDSAVSYEPFAARLAAGTTTPGAGRSTCW